MSDLASAMSCIEVRHTGGPEMLRLAVRPTPHPQHDEVLIKVAAAGVNRPDVAQRAGAYPPPKGASDLLGLEVSGVVAEVGASVTRWRVGDYVVALAPGGGYAEYCAVNAAHVLPWPKGPQGAFLSPQEAAALPEACFTVWSNVFDRGALKAGQSFLIHGGSSGVGVTAIQLANIFGARVFTTAGGVEKCAACRDLGAERAINYREEDFVEVVREATDGRGADLILDMVGGDYIAQNVRVAAEDGRIVSIGFLNGAVAQLNFARVMVKRLTLTGSTLRPRSIEYKSMLAQTLEREVWPLIRQGRFAPVMDKNFPLEHARAAHERMESSEHIGKITLTP